MLAEKVSNESWRAVTLERLARDLKKPFPDLPGFSLRNFKYMRQFAEYFPDDNRAAVAAQIAWGRNMIILGKIESLEQRLRYIQQSIKHGWSLSMLETCFYQTSISGKERQSPTLIKETLPSPQSDLAEQILRDPYNFSFLVLNKRHRERKLEQGLMDHLQKFLKEFEEGFAFVDRQFCIEIEVED